MHHAPITAAEGHNLPPYWFADPRALEIVAEVVSTNGACLGRSDRDVAATHSIQRERGVVFTGPLVDELNAIRTAAMPAIDEALDWSNSAHLNYYRTQRTWATDMLLAALDWRPNGGGSHDAALYAFMCALSVEGAGA